MPLLALKVHSKTLRQNTHCNFTHCISCFPSEETGVNWGRDNNDTTIPAIGLEVRQDSLNRTIESFGIDLLHQLEPSRRRILDRSPPDSSTVVHEYVQATVCFDCLIDQVLYASQVPRIDCNSCRISPGFPNFSLDSIDR